MGLERARERGLCPAFSFPSGAINQGLGEKYVTLPVSSPDVSRNNSQTLPGQWARAYGQPSRSPRDGRGREKGSLAR